MKKKIVVALATIVAIVLFLFAIAFVVFGIASYKGFSVSEGQVLITDKGSYLIIMDNSPIEMSNQSKNQEIFEGLTNGDKILIVHDGIQESYPGGTGVYFCKKLSDGEYKDLPENVLSSLTDLGWINTPKIVGELVKVEKDNRMLSLIIPEGWEYATYETLEHKELSDLAYTFFIEFWPEGRNEGSILFACDKNFGVCGTGLECKDVVIGGHTCSMGIYDNSDAWSFITIDVGSDIDYFILNYAQDSWWDEYGTEAMEILDTLEYR